MRVPPTIALIARLLLGGFFLYSGLAKALHPADFLKLLRAYELTQSALPLNAIAATLPWFEAFCGLLLILGIAIRGTALVCLSMLVPFTIVVARRALAIQTAQGLAFCAIRFDCGCGTGEVAICYKLVENGLLVLISLALVFAARSTWAFRHQLLGSTPPPSTST